MSTPIDKLVHAFSKLPGIGEKTAARLVFFLLRSQKKLTQDLAGALQDLHDKVKLCSECCNVTDLNPCRICQDERRDASLLCVVEEPPDMAAIERTKTFKGRYHILHGSLSPLDGIGPEELKIKELLLRLQETGTKEIILATNANVEGDATALYLSRLLKPLGHKITRLSLGLPVGGELEYVDPSTLSKALEERREIR